jgi:ABC-type protease/lipase transport system fused ATPase/permease subunit
MQQRGRKSAVALAGAIVIMIANWAGARAVCDKVLVLWDGLQQAFTDCALILWRPLPQ